jgi:HK97 family phage portal protein
MFFRKPKKQIEIKKVPVGITPDWLTDRAHWSDWSTENAVSDGYKSSPWVYAAIKLRANAVASVPLVVEIKKGSEWHRAEEHPLLKILESPNVDLDGNELMRLFVTHLDLSGNAYLLKTRDGTGKPLELWPMLPHYVQIMPGRERLIKAYQYSYNGVYTYDSSDIVHCAYTNPSSLFFGMSPLEAAGKSVDADNAAAAWQKISMQNRGVPDGIFSFDADMTHEQWQQAVLQVKDQYTGVGASRAPWVLSKAKYQQLAMTPVELDFKESRLLAMKQICAVYGVPHEMISGMGDANRASSDTVRKTFWLDTVLPLLSEIEAALNISLISDFGDRKTLRIRFDTSGVGALQESYTEKLDNARKLFDMGVPFNTITKTLELGIEEIEGGDSGYLNSGLIPASFDFDELDPTNAARAAYGETENEE